jgi:hypothetical protein
MTINRGANARTRVKPAEAFIGRAPYAPRKGVVRGRKEQITLTIAP